MRIVRLLIATVVATAGVAVAPAAVAASGDWVLQAPRLPKGLPTGDNADFGRPSCSAPGECIAVGRYTIPTGPHSGTEVALIESVSNGQARVVAAPLPGHVARTESSSDLSAVSCWQPGSCVAVGGYARLDGRRAAGPLVETLSDGVWTPSVVPDTTNGTHHRHGGLSDVACNADRCIAIGTYRTPSGDFVPYATERTSDGSWTVHDLSVPAGNWDPPLELASPTCPPAGACVFIANGDHDTDSTIEADSYLVYRSGNVWTGVRFPTWNHDPVRAYTMDCSSAGNCIALATIGADGRRDPLVAEVLSDGVLSREQIMLPSAPDGRRIPYPTSIDCPADGACVATVLDRVADVVSHQVTELGTVLLRRSDDAGWIADRAPVPPDEQGSPARVMSVSCATETTCTAVGAFNRIVDGHAVERPLVVTTTGGAWSLRELGLPPGADPENSDGLFAVACTEAVCVATGNDAKSASEPSRTAGMVGIGSAG